MRETGVHSVYYKQSRIAHSTLWNVFFVYTCDSPKIIYYKAIFGFFLVLPHSLYPFAFRRTEKLCHILNRQSHTEWMEIMALLNTTFTSIEILFIQRHRHFDMAFVVIPKKTQRTHLNVKFATKKTENEMNSRQRLDSNTRNIANALWNAYKNSFWNEIYAWDCLCICTVHTFIYMQFQIELY